jgi:phosphoglycolate phosphatase
VKLLIFDIDGTLTHLVGATRRAFNDVFMKVFGVSAHIMGLKMHGRTDPMIFRDCFELAGLLGSWREAYVLFQKEYVKMLSQHIAESSGAHLHAGVIELLRELHHRKADVALALGTGNMEAGGRAKIGHFGINHYFPVGGFGDQHERRPEIIRDAVANADAHWQRKFNLRDTWVIGDTEYDISGGKALGLMTMGVATGGEYSVEQLIAAGADVVFADFADTAAVLKAFGLD